VAGVGGGMLAVGKQGMVLERKKLEVMKLRLASIYVLRTDQVSSAIGNDVGFQI